MPYFDPSTMRLPQSPSAVESIGSGLKLKEMFQQQQQYQRQQGFMQAIGEIVQSGVDYKTPEGQQKLVQGLAAKGYGAEAFDLAQKFPQAASNAGKWSGLTGAEGSRIVNDATGEIRETGYSKPGKEAEDKWSGTAWVTSGGKRVLVDANGLDKNGKPVIQDKEPKGADGIKPENIFAMEQKLSNDFRSTAGKSIDVATANNKINEALTQNNPLDAYNAIVQFVKIIDPGTAAREGEVSSAKLNSSGGAGQKLIQAARSAYNGTLDPETIKNIRESSAALMRGEKKTFDSQKKFFESKIASYNKRGYNLDRNAILGDFDSLFQEPQSPAPSKSDPAMPTFEQYDSLPSGAEFTDPDGNVRRKP